VNLYSLFVDITGTIYVSDSVVKQSIFSRISDFAGKIISAIFLFDPRPARL